MTLLHRAIFFGSGALVAIVASIAGWSNLQMLTGWAIGVATVSLSEALRKDGL